MIGGGSSGGGGSGCGSGGDGGGGGGGEGGNGWFLARTIKDGAPDQDGTSKSYAQIDKVDVFLSKFLIALLIAPAATRFLQGHRVSRSTRTGYGRLHLCLGRWHRPTLGKYLTTQHHGVFIQPHPSSYTARNSSVVEKLS